jgi:hypothetical protein
MELMTIMLSNRRQALKVKNRMFSLICETIHKMMMMMTIMEHECIWRSLCWGNQQKENEKGEEIKR